MKLAIPAVEDRPGGRVSLIDTDWSTVAIEVGDHDLTSRVGEATVGITSRRVADVQLLLRYAGQRPECRR